MLCCVCLYIASVHFSSVQSLSRVRLFVTPWNATYHASLSFTISQSLREFMSIESVMPSNHLILCCPFLHLFSIFYSIRVFSSVSVFHIRWPKCVCVCIYIYISVQFSLSVVSDSLRPHESQHTRPPCPSPTPRVYPNSRPLSR